MWQCTIMRTIINIDYAIISFYGQNKYNRNRLKSEDILRINRILYQFRLKRDEISRY